MALKNMSNGVGFKAVCSEPSVGAYNMGPPRSWARFQDLKDPDYRQPTKADLDRLVAAYEKRLRKGAKLGEVE